MMAFTGLLMVYYRQSKRRTAEFLSTLLGQPCCAALTVKMQTQVTAALRPSYEALAAELPTQDQLSADETPTKEQNGKAWLWTFVARAFTVFAVRATREATALDDLLTDEFRGIVTCDRAKMYWRVKRLQWCWAHLKRDFQALIDGGDGQAKRLGYDLRRATCKLFEHSRVPRCCVAWHRSAARWIACCCAVPRAAIDGSRGRAGSYTTIASGCGRFCGMKGSSPRTMPPRDHCVTP